MTPQEKAKDLYDSYWYCLLQSNIDTEKGRIDAILSASDADKDSFAEIVSLINKAGGSLLGPNNIGLINKNYTDTTFQLI